jgi:LacI family transcriptional regulator
MAQDEHRRAELPTIVDVARESGVSYSTVSRVLNNYEYVKPATREKVLQAAQRLGYVPNQQARSLAGGRSNLIGVLVPGLDNGYIIEIVRGIDEELAQAGYNLILYTTHRHEGREAEYISGIVNGAADGLLLVVPMISATYLEVLHQRNFPCVLIDQSDPAAQNTCVYASNVEGAYAATRHLIELGHRRIGFITGLMGLQSAVDRLQGYTNALNDHGIARDDRLIVHGNFMESGGRGAANTLLDLDPPPTAIFASNDLSAFGAIAAIRERGLRVPEDISVVGFDDLPQARMSYPRLTTVHQPIEEMGRIAVRMLLQQIETPDSAPTRVMVETHLILRDSSAPPHTYERG